MVAQEVRFQHAPIEAHATPLERLEAEITELAGHLAAAECRWLLLIAEYDRRAGYEAVGLSHVRALAELALRPRPARRPASVCASPARSRSCR